MTFIIGTDSDGSFDRIMTYIVSKSLTHMKTQRGGTTEFEVHGLQENYNYFDTEIKAGRIRAYLEYVV